MKKAFTIFFITLMFLGSFTLGYCHNYPVYAEIEDENLYEPLRQQSDLVKAFQAYCKSRDLTIEGSALDAVTTWTTSAFNIACNRVGLNMTQIQAEIKAQYDANGQPLKYLFYATGVDAMNRIFAQFLQDNELEVGEAVDDTVYDGKYYNDSEYQGLFYIADDLLNSEQGISKSHILQYGSYYKYNTSDLWNIANTSTYTYLTFQFGDTVINNSSSLRVRILENQTFNNSTYNLLVVNGRYHPISTIPATSIYGYTALFYETTTESYYIGMLEMNSGWASVNNSNFHYHKVNITDDLKNNPNVANNVTINITTNNNVINNNTYEGDTIIYPDGEPSNPDDPPPDPPVVGPDPDAPTDPLPSVDPDYPDDPVTPQTPPDWDIELPDFTDFDWIMTGLEKKFPWDIPFNIMFMMSLFVAEPEAPHFVGDIDLKVTTWHYDLDLSPFEEIAKLFRTFFFLGFILGLMLLTKQLIWG